MMPDGVKQLIELVGHFDISWVSWIYPLRYEFCQWGLYASKKWT